MRLIDLSIKYKRTSFLSHDHIKIKIIYESSSQKKNFWLTEKSALNYIIVLKSILFYHSQIKDMIDIVSAVDADEETSNSNNEQSFINEEDKQTNLHSLLISKSTSSSDSARNDADKDRQQVEAIKKLSIQLHTEQASNKKNLSVEFKQFASNAQENEDSDDEIDIMMLETNEALKSNDFRQAIYKKAE